MGKRRRRGKKGRFRIEVLSLRKRWEKWRRDGVQDKEIGINPCWTNISSEALCV